MVQLLRTIEPGISLLSSGEVRVVSARSPFACRPATMRALWWWSAASHDRSVLRGVCHESVPSPLARLDASGHAQGSTLRAAPHRPPARTREGQQARAAHASPAGNSPRRSGAQGRARCLPGDHQQVQASLPQRVKSELQGPASGHSFPVPRLEQWLHALPLLAGSPGVGRRSHPGHTTLGGTGPPHLRHAWHVAGAACRWSSAGAAPACPTCTASVRWSPSSASSTARSRLRCSRPMTSSPRPASEARQL